MTDDSPKPHSPSPPPATLLRRVVQAVAAIPKIILVAIVRCYQYFISPLLGPRCRFDPTCSEYFILAVHKHGPIRGACKGVWRVCRCNPWMPGGYDPP
jgi:putative membrane protein insertion efficiency factor